MLADYNPERREIVLKGGSFHVTGLSLNVLAALLKTHLSEAGQIFELIEGKITLDQVDKAGLAATLITEAPGLAANIIALAAGEPNAAAQAAQLPAPVQIEALEMIGDLTFNEVGGVKKTLETLLRLMGLRQTLAQDSQG